MAEGCFSQKNDGSIFYSIKQTGIENYPIIKAICLKLVNRNINIKPDSQNSYQLTLASRADIQKVVNFFSFSDNHPLIGYKLSQYNIFLQKIKESNRYKDVNVNNYIKSNE
jgi:hypothetical protein